MSTRLDDDASAWRRAIFEAKRVAFATLSEADRAEAAADRAAMREASAARREAKRRARLTIAAMLLDGDTPAEISAKTGLSIAALWHRRLYWGLPIAARRGCRRLFAWLPDDDVAALDALALDMGLDRGRALEALLRAALMDGAAVARRTLGVRRSATA